MNLSDDKILFKKIIANASEFFSIPRSYIEKDFYAISLLKRVININSNIVFKGGTCLSKCYNVIERFSEDIDVSVIEDHLTQGQRRSLVHENIEKSINELGLTLSNPDSIRSKRVFNRFICKYNTLVDASETFANVLFELAMQSPCFPYEERICQTFAGRYLDETNNHDLTIKYGLEAFKVKTQKLERTFVDKIYAVCDYQISKKLERNSRHLYDLHKILPKIKLDDDLIELFTEVRKYRVTNETCYSVQGDNKLHILFDALINEETFKNDFNNVTSPLLYDDTKYSDIYNSLLIISNFLNKYAI